MNYTWRERFARWLCEKFGHKARIEYDNPGGGDPEICKRCNRLLSTAYSRERAANAGIEPNRPR